MNDEFLKWEKKGALETSSLIFIEDILKIINFDNIPYNDYKKNLDFNSKSDMIRGYFYGIVKSVQEMKRIIHKANKEGPIEDILEISTKLKNIFIDYDLMEPIQWEQVAVFDYEGLEDDEALYVIYKDQNCKELGRESVGNIIRTKIEINTVRDLL